MPATLVFTTSSHWLSRVIRSLTSSATSHAAIGTEVFGEPVLIHSALDGETGKTGVQITPRNKWFRDNELVAEYEIIPDVVNNMRPMIQHLCDKYDKMGLIGYVIVLVAKWLGKKIMNPLASAKAYVCSRYVLKLDPSGELIPEWKGLDPQLTTPQDLLLLCRGGQSFKRVTDVAGVE
jgi:hypothetical protein